MQNAAILCPLRKCEGKLEVLLTRRAFWNHLHNQAMSFPGEWLFPGGKYEFLDHDLAETAIREFREETGYQNPIRGVQLLRTGYSNGSTIHFYTAQITSASFQPTSSEVIDIQWKNPREWLSYIQSVEFNTQQMHELEEYQILQRQMPVETIATLKHLCFMEELK